MIWCHSTAGNCMSLHVVNTGGPRMDPWGIPQRREPPSVTERNLNQPVQNHWSHHSLSVNCADVNAVDVSVTLLFSLGVNYTAMTTKWLRTSRLACRSLSRSLRILCCSALSARRFSWKHKSKGRMKSCLCAVLSVDRHDSFRQALTIRSLRPMSSSSSFFLHSKWASISDCSSIRSLFWRFFWMSCKKWTDESWADRILVVHSAWDKVAGPKPNLMI